MRIRRTIIPKVLCGLAVALAMTNLPLPVLADGEQAVIAPETALTTQTDDAATTTPLTLQESAPSPTAVLEETPLTTTGSAQSQTGSTAPQPQVTAQVNNQLDSQATSGNATVAENETGGNASTGNADAEATVVNVVNANGTTAKGFTTFQCDVNRDTQENLVIDPTSLLPICKTTSVGTSTQPAANTQGMQTGASLVDILNDIALTATSGNADVSNNETGGNASTGNATALANIVNIANTAITAENSFLGVINIRGDLRGDILVPQAIVDSLTGTQSGGLPFDTTSIANNISADAISGNATVADNEQGGNASSGEAITSLTVMNLTGQKVVAKNSLLVFVNVLGKWMGLIVPAGQGQNTALLGSGVQQSGSASTGVAEGTGGTATNITNNINVKAASGDATVSGNEEGGNATTGDAKAGVNLLNITNSEFQLDKWFGILFINVLGSWLGNFDIQSALKPNADGQTPPVVRGVQVYQFSQAATVAAPASSAPAAPAVTTTSAAAAIPEAEQPSAPVNAVLGSSQQNDSGQAKPSFKLDMVGLGIVIVGLTALIASGTLAVRHWYSA